MIASYGQYSAHGVATIEFATKAGKMLYAAKWHGSLTNIPIM